MYWDPVHLSLTLTSPFYPNLAELEHITGQQPLVWARGVVTRSGLSPKELELALRVAERLLGISVTTTWRTGEDAKNN